MLRILLLPSPVNLGLMSEGFFVIDEVFSLKTLLIPLPLLNLSFSPSIFLYISLILIFPSFILLLSSLELPLATFPGFSALVARRKIHLQVQTPFTLDDLVPRVLKPDFLKRPSSRNAFYPSIYIDPATN
jgi:hypothetical protein